MKVGNRFGMFGLLLRLFLGYFVRVAYGWRWRNRQGIDKVDPGEDVGRFENMYKSPQSPKKGGYKIFEENFYHPFLGLRG